MQKGSRRQQFMLMLPGVMLLAALLIGGGEAFTRSIPTASAANSHDQSETYAQGKETVQVSQSIRATEPGNCPAPGEHRSPSFGSGVWVTSGEVICSDLTSFGGSVTISGKVDSNVVTFGGKVTIYGEVDGNVVTFGGDMVVAGKVNGNVTLYGGNLYLEHNAHVNGDIHVCGGQLAEDADSELHGNVFACTKSIGELFLSDGDTSFHFWFTLAWIILGMLLITLLPEHVMFVRSTVQNKAKRSLALGFLTILLTPAILVVLIALIISIPLAILVAVVLLAAWALGTVAIGTLIGDRVLRSIAPQHNTRLTQVIVGTALLALVGSLPVIGFISSIGVGLLGTGAVFLSHFGTRICHPPRRPLSF